MQGAIDNFTQCGRFFRNVLSKDEKERLTDNIAGSLVAAQDFIQARAIANFAACDADYGRMVAAKVDKLKKEKARVPRAAPSKPAALNPPRRVKSNL